MGIHEYGKKPHPQWIIVSCSLALVAVAFVGASLVSDSEVTSPGMTYTFPKPTATSEKPCEPLPRVTVTHPVPGPVRTRWFVRTVTVTAAPLPRKTVTASPEPAATVTKTVRPSPTPGPTVTVTETVTASPTKGP
jgi:hypothetical protein